MRAVLWSDQEVGEHRVYMGYIQGYRGLIGVRYMGIIWDKGASLYLYGDYMRIQGCHGGYMGI